MCHRDFLSYIVDALLEGRADRIKAYFIAVDVFGRPESFDPTLDPIVRIEATRLRVALEQFYQATGTPLGVRLDLPRGKYPVFMPAPVSSPVPPPSCEEGQLDPVPSDPAPPDPFRRRVRMGPRGKIACQRMAPRPAGGVAGVLVVGLTLAVRLLAFLPAGFSTGRPLAASAAYIEKPIVEFVIEGGARAPPMLVETVNDILVAAGHFSTIRPRFRGLNRRPMQVRPRTTSSAPPACPGRRCRCAGGSTASVHRLHSTARRREANAHQGLVDAIDPVPAPGVEHRGGQGDYLVDLQSDLLWDLNTPEVAP